MFSLQLCQYVAEPGHKPTRRNSFGIKFQYRTLRRTRGYGHYARGNPGGGRRRASQKKANPHQDAFINDNSYNITTNFKTVKKHLCMFTRKLIQYLINTMYLIRWSHLLNTPCNFFLFQIIMSTGSLYPIDDCYTRLFYWGPCHKCARRLGCSYQ